MPDIHFSVSATKNGDEIHVDGVTPEQALIVRHLANGLAGGDPGDYAHYIRGLKYRAAMVLLACIQEAFVVKSAGGIGEDGIKWAPLARSTVAARRIGPGDILKEIGVTKRKFGYGARKQSKKDLDAAGRLKRGFLTAAQNDRWRMIFASRKNYLMARHGLGAGAAAARAAAIAWATLKAEGAQTRLQVLGGRVVQIGRDTGRLLSSISPVSFDPDRFPLDGSPERVPDQILREERGAIVVGSNVEYAVYFHAKRPLWPDGNLPEPWKLRITEALQSGIQEILQSHSAA